MRRIYFADTNVFLRYLLADVPNQLKIVKEYFERAKKEEIVIVLAPVVLFELIFALRESYGFRKTEVVVGVGKLLTLPYLDIENRELISRTLILFNRTSLDLVDCYLRSRADLEFGELLTFDKKLGLKS